MRCKTFVFNFILLLSHISAQWQAYRKWISTFERNRMKLTFIFTSTGLPFVEGQRWQVQFLGRSGPVWFPGISRLWFHLHVREWICQPGLRYSCRSVPSQVDLRNLHGFLYGDDFPGVFVRELCINLVCSHGLCSTHGVKYPSGCESFERLHFAEGAWYRSEYLCCRCLSRCWHELALSSSWWALWVSSSDDSWICKLM